VVETTESFSLLEINETNKANYAFYDLETTVGKEIEIIEFAVVVLDNASGFW
jgi:hypothetical protein